MGQSSASTTIRRAVGLRNVEVYGHIGFYPEERKMGRLFRLNIHAEYRVDSVENAPPIDYRDIAALVNGYFAQPGILIEHAAERLALAIIEKWAAVEKVRVEVYKVHPPIGILAESAYAYVEMERT